MGDEWSVIFSTGPRATRATVPHGVPAIGEVIERHGARWRVVEVHADEREAIAHLIVTGTAAPDVLRPA
jgi:hypothetical protein